jgi:hypothetical protein
MTTAQRLTCDSTDELIVNPPGAKAAVAAVVHPVVERQHPARFAEEERRPHDGLVPLDLFSVLTVMLCHHG